MLSRTKLILLIPFVTLLGCGEQAPSDPEVRRTVLTYRVGSDNTDDGYRFAGKLQAADRASLSFETNGVVKSLSVNLGDAFDSGALLGRLDDRNSRINLEGKQAELLDAKATLRDAQLEFDRRLKLLESKAVSVSSVDQAEARLESARARLAAAQAGVENANKRLADVRLIAPFAGEVVSRLVEPSQVVNAGQPILEVIGNEAGLEAVVNVPFFIRESLLIGDEARIKLLTSKLHINASVSEIGKRANSAGLFPVTLKISEASEKTSPGQSIEVLFSSSEAISNGLMIPLTAYFFDADGVAFAYRVDKQNRVRRRTIELGTFSGSGVKVIKGLKVGDVIVTKGVDLLKEGQLVEPVENSHTRFGN